MGQWRYFSGMGEEREIIFEFIRRGAAVKVTAVDTATGIEASIVGDPASGQAALRRLARQKLDYVLAKGRAGR
ncbi:MAG TPA: hypothetical protein VMU87_03920 [Stellaceae bacterium]|nr:hypothetical protein [Stellaceae bacterium]